jgi:hypothetical protein
MIKLYEEDIWKVAHKTLSIKEVSNIPKLKSKKESDNKIENKYNQNIVIKAILSIANAINLKKITNKIKKVYTKIKEEKHLSKIEQEVEKMGELKQELQQTLKFLRTENENIVKQETKEFIQKRVDKIRTLRISNPERFFARA